MRKFTMTTIGKAAKKTLRLLRKMPRVKMIATAGLGIALATTATQGSKTYKQEEV